jgi:REP element-mobilizing transposase RayT
MKIETISRDSVVKRKHDLPHWQFGDSVYFITFRSAIGELNEESRLAVLEVIRAGNLKKFQCILAVAMLDHVHIMMRPLKRRQEEYWDLSGIMKAIKGTSARKINLLLGKDGPVWQKESYDRIIRDEDEYRQVENYILHNPLTAGLASQIGDYKFALDLSALILNYNYVL